MALTQIPDELIIRSRMDVSGATRTNPCVIAATGHGFSEGDRIYLTGLGGITQINNRVFTIANVEADTFELSGENAISYVAYTGGGAAFQRLGTAINFNAGTAANHLVPLDGTAKLPAVDGSQITNLSTGPTLLATKNMLGAVVEFTGIPSTATQLTLIIEEGLWGVGTPTRIQLGNASAYITSGYTGAVFRDDQRNAVDDQEENHQRLFSTDFLLSPKGWKSKQSAEIKFIKVSGDIWSFAFTGIIENTVIPTVGFFMGNGHVDVTAALTRLKIFSNNGASLWVSGHASLYVE